MDLAGSIHLPLRSPTSTPGNPSQPWQAKCLTFCLLCVFRMVASPLCSHLSHEANETIDSQSSSKMCVCSHCVGPANGLLDVNKRMDSFSLDLLKCEQTGRAPCPVYLPTLPLLSSTGLSVPTKASTFLPAGLRDLREWRGWSVCLSRGTGGRRGPGVTPV